MELKMAKAIKLTPELQIEVLEFTEGDSYQMLIDAVEGYIECVRLTPTLDMWLNESGKVDGLETNNIATQIFWDRFGYMSDIIVGNAVFTSFDSEGETTGLTDKEIEYLNKYLSLSPLN
jgi:hypothetical protein